MISSSGTDLTPLYTPQNPFHLVRVNNPWSIPGWYCVKSFTIALSGSEITDDILVECVGLFNSNFGVWSTVADQFKTARAGTAVKTDVRRLRMQCVQNETACTLVRHYIEDKLVGYAFATRWAYHKMKGNVCWVTQLVVDQSFRGLGIATRVLNKLKTDSDALFGIVASHPAALMALSRIASGTSISSVNLDFIRKHTCQVLLESSIDSLRTSKPHGSLFITPSPKKSGESDEEDEDEDDGTICCVESEFFIDHDEALEALDYLESKGIKWPLGDLLEGVEFLLLVENKDRITAKARPIV